MKVKVKFLRCLNKPDVFYDDISIFKICDLSNGIRHIRLIKVFYDDNNLIDTKIIDLEDVRYLHIDDGVKHYIIQVV